MTHMVQSKNPRTFESRNGPEEVSNSDAPLKRQVCSCLAQIAKHSAPRSEVASEVFREEKKTGHDYWRCSSPRPILCCFNGHLFERLKGMGTSISGGMAARPGKPFRSCSTDGCTILEERVGRGHVVRGHPLTSSESVRSLPGFGLCLPGLRAGGHLPCAYSVDLAGYPPPPGASVVCAVDKGLCWQGAEENFLIAVNPPFLVGTEGNPSVNSFSSDSSDSSMILCLGGAYSFIFRHHPCDADRVHVPDPRWIWPKLWWRPRSSPTSCTASRTWTSGLARSSA